MPQRKLTIRNNQVEDLIQKSAYKSKLKPYTESPKITEIRKATEKALLNDMFVSAETKVQIEFGLLGVKSAPVRKVVTIDEDRANRASKHAEISLQATFCTWVKDNYPKVRFIRHEREGKRSYVAQNINKKLNNAGSMPDMEFLEPVGKYLGLFIEFKRPGEGWLLMDGVTVKKAYAKQYENHCMLWDKGYVVYFCNDFEIAKQIFIQYYAGRNMRQRIYKVK